MTLVNLVWFAMGAVFGASLVLGWCLSRIAAKDTPEPPERDVRMKRTWGGQ